MAPCRSVSPWPIPNRTRLPAALLLLGFIGTGSSFLSASLFLERRGIGAADFPRKGIYYIGGLAEGGETIAVVRGDVPVAVVVSRASPMHSPPSAW